MSIDRKVIHIFALCLWLTSFPTIVDSVESFLKNLAHQLTLLRLMYHFRLHRRWPLLFVDDPVLEVPYDLLHSAVSVVKLPTILKRIVQLIKVTQIRNFFTLDLVHFEGFWVAIIMVSQVIDLCENTPNLL